MSKPLLLVVEDDAIVRLDFVDLAQSIGFRVVEATSADEALKLLERHSDIRVIFTDIQMPGTMDGLGLMRVVKERWPPKVVVVCSGNRHPANYELPDDVTFLRKPCNDVRTEDVLQAIKSRLAA